MDVDFITQKKQLGSFQSSVDSIYPFSPECLYSIIRSTENHKVLNDSLEVFSMNQYKSCMESKSGFLRIHTGDLQHVKKSKSNI